MFRRLLSSSTIAVLAMALTVALAHAESISCQLQAGNGGYEGTCAIPCSVNALAVDFDGINAKRACTGPLRTVKASLQPAKDGNWLGRMEGKQPEDPTRFEWTAAKAGAPDVGKLPFGWFAVLKSERTADRWTFDLDARRQRPPTNDDVRILMRAREMLASDAVWNKEDNRQCPPGQAKISLFCSLQLSTTEVSGGVHYRQPALQAAREVLNEVGVGRFKLHRIMDYNNHPDTTLAEIHALIDKAKSRIEARLK